MAQIRKIKVTTGIYWVEIPQADLRILCGCPADAVKHLKKRGLIEEVEREGMNYETGPNAILLSDVLMQNGHFSNLTEFPTLQMMYLQGMIIPNHPNNVGVKPLLLGSEEQLEAQLNYIYRGNYGLVSEEEMIEAGIAPDYAKKLMQIKLNFAFGKITPQAELLEQRIVAGAEPTEIRNGVHIKRTAFNIFDIHYHGEVATVDLNLKPEERYEAPFQLGYHFIERDYFSVVHSGEGDGWDIHRPCMASVIVFQGKIYLIDAGPNILTTLNYLGISVNEIEGIFHTHAHDDHFAGLTTLIRTDHRFKYFSTPLVRAAVTKKLCALMSVPESSFENFFDIQDLEFDKWCNADGMEVMPIYSPHPVETNIFYFRVQWQGEYKIYGHLADVVAFDVFKRMIASEENPNGLPQEFYNKIHAQYLQKAHLKKIDVGGGLIHGEAENYRQDPSDKIVLAHTHKPLTLKQREIGSSAAFGMVDVLVKANHDYLVEFAHKHLKFYFPDAPDYELAYLLNHPIEKFNAGTILFKKGEVCKYVYLLITGSVEFTDTHEGNNYTLSAGSLVGFYAGYLGLEATATYRAASNLSVLALPAVAYHAFVTRNNLYASLRQMEEHILFLENTWLFGEVVSFPILSQVARNMTKLSAEEFAEGANLDSHLFLLRDGEATIYQEDESQGMVQRKGDFFGGHDILFEGHPRLKVSVKPGSLLYAIPCTALPQIPVVYWKLIETNEKRLRRLA